MIGSLHDRATQAEKMDDERAGGEELRQAYRHLRRLNRLFGAAAPVRYGVTRLWHAAGRPRKLTVLDIGAGAGDVNRALLRWADRQKIDLRITAIDSMIEACDEARMMYRDEPRVSIEQANLFALPGHHADIVTATQFVHHFSASELPTVVSKMVQTSRIGIVMNDIHRHIIPWAAVWLTTRIISNNDYIRHDGPLSVAKGFRREDWERLGAELHIPDVEMEVSWRPLFRYAVTIRRC